MTLKIVGAGFGRTGTVSLKVALEQLGFGPAYHMSEVLKNPANIDLWLNVAAGKPDWKTVFAGYHSSVDFPACTYWRELAAAYPDAKVLLSVRDPDQWYESTQATIMSPRMHEAIRGTPFGDLNDKTVWRLFEGRIHDRGAMVARFKLHTEEVKAAIPADRLLVYEVSQGWAPLCKFLGVSEPSAPFPRTNPRDEFGPLIDMIAAGSVNPDDPRIPPGLRDVLRRKPG